MEQVSGGRCEFCGEEKKYLSANQFHGWYCEDCIKLAIYYERECLKEIKEAKEIAKKLTKK